MIKHIQSNVDSELERWVVRNSAGPLQSAYAGVSTNSHTITSCCHVSQHVSTLAMRGITDALHFLLMQIWAYCQRYIAQMA